MLKRITSAYRLGKEYATTSGNAFWFRQLTEDHTNYIHPVEEWDTRQTEIKNIHSRMSWIERIAFSIGDDVFTLTSPLRPKNPLTV